MTSGKLSAPARPLLQKFLGFALVGAVGTIAHYTVLAALVEIWHVPVLTATTVGFTVGGLVNYALSRRLIFASDAGHHVALPKFFTVAILGAVANWLVVAWLVERVGMHYLFAQLCATGTVLFWNFAANHLWTFRK